jgi:hypothetical protein
MKTGFLLSIGLMAAVVYAGEFTFKTLTLSKEDYYKGTARYPEFLGKSEVEALANSRISAWVNKSLKDFAQESNRAFRQLGQPRAAYEFLATGTVSTHTMRLISCYFTVYSYTGGAHGNTGFVPFNFGIIRGKATSLKLADLFMPGYDYRTAVNDMVMARLSMNDRAAWVQNGEVTKLTNPQMEQFVILKDGLMFLFEPYAMGPYSAGSFKVKLTFEEIGFENLNRGLLLAR